MAKEKYRYAAVIMDTFADMGVSHSFSNFTNHYASNQMVADVYYDKMDGSKASAVRAIADYADNFEEAEKLIGHKVIRVVDLPELIVMHYVDSIDGYKSDYHSVILTIKRI